jgi:hypothetical protein
MPKAIPLAFLLPTLCLIGFVAVGVRLGWFRAGELMMDPAALSGKPVYFGSLATLGCFAWFGTVVLCILGSLMAGAREGGRWRRMFLGFGALSLLLMVDDWLLLHEHVFPLQLGIDEAVTFGMYGLLLATLLVIYRQILWKIEEWPMLALALGFFALSMVADLLGPTGASPPQGLLMLEDGAKLMGISAWMGFFFAAVLRQHRTLLRAR